LLPQIWQNLAGLQRQAGEVAAACDTFRIALDAAVTQFGESTRWASAARWKQASIMFEMGRRVRHIHLNIYIYHFLSFPKPRDAMEICFDQEVGGVILNYYFS